MTGNREILSNFKEKFGGTVRYGNNQFSPILGYGDVIQENITIKKVSFVEGLGHNFYSIGKLCDKGLGQKRMKLFSSDTQRVLLHTVCITR